LEGYILGAKNKMDNTTNFGSLFEIREAVGKEVAIMKGNVSGGVVGAVIFVVVLAIGFVAFKMFAPTGTNGPGAAQQEMMNKMHQMGNNRQPAGVRPSR